MSSYFRQQLEKYLSSLTINCERCLDVGGSQYPIKKRLKSFKCLDYLILDLEKPHEVKQEPDITLDLNYGLIRTSYTDREMIREGFDVIFCLEVMEYIYNPFGAIGALYQMTKPGGELYISFGFVYPVHNPASQDYLRYTPRGAEKLLTEAGFKVERVVPRLESDLGLSFVNFTISQKMRPAKNYDKHNWVGCICKCKKEDKNGG